MIRKCVVQLFLPLLVLLVVFGLRMESASAKTVTYTIKPTSKPLQKDIMNSKKYTSDTKHYFLIDSYLRQLEKKKGGKLILKEGVYRLSNTLYIPSNVTIQFNNGVYIKKLNSTKTKQMKPSKELFVLLAPSKQNKTAVYGKYNGEKNIRLIGKGDVTVDLQYKKAVKAIVMGHNNNVMIDGIDFINAYGTNFVHMVASKNVTIQNSSFKNSHQTEEALEDKNGIHIDTPDEKTKDWPYKWSKFDNTPNENVTIQNNLFLALDRAIGTRKYSIDKFHKNIRILNNQIRYMRSDAIRVISWSRPIIKGNIIDTVGDDSNFKSLRGILVSGAQYPTITENLFKTVARGIQFIVWKNEGYGKRFPLVRNVLSTTNKEELKRNQFLYTEENFIRINDKGFEDYGNPEKIKVDKDYRFEQNN